MQSNSQKVFSDNLKLTSSQVIIRIFSIFFLIAYTRILTPFELSLLPVFDIIAEMSPYLFNFGLMTTLIREVPKLMEKDREKASSLLCTSSLIVATGVAVFSIMAFLFSRNIAYVFFKEVRFAYLIELMSIGFFLRGLDNILTFNMRSTLNFGKLALKNIISGISQKFFGIVLFFIWGLKGLIIGLNLGMAIGVFISLYFLRDYLFKRFKWYPIKKMLKFSFPYYIEGYLHYFRNRGDQLIIGAFFNPVLLSTYYIARKLFDNLSFFSRSIDETITPALSKVSYFGMRKVEESFKKINTLISYFAIPLCFLATSLSYAFVNLIGEKKYLGATVPTAILCLTLLLHFFMIPFSRSIFVVGKPKERLKITAVQSFSILLFLILLIKNFGILGVAISRFLAVLVTLLYSYFALKKLIIVRINTKAIINSLFGSIVMASLISFFQIIYYRLYLIPLYASVGIASFLIIFIRSCGNEEIKLIETLLPEKLKNVTQVLYRFRPSLKVSKKEH